MPFDITYTLDPRGNTLTASGVPFFPTAPATSTYDAANRTVSYSGTGFLGPFNETHTWDANGNLIQRAGIGADTVTSTYDALNRITGLDHSAVGTEVYTYDALGRLSSVAVPAPVAGEPPVQRFFYDERGNLITVYGAAPGNTVLEKDWHNDPDSTPGQAGPLFIEAGFSERSFQLGGGSGGPLELISGTLIRTRGTSRQGNPDSYLGRETPADGFSLISQKTLESEPRLLSALATRVVDWKRRVRLPQPRDPDRRQPV